MKPNSIREVLENFQYDGDGNKLFTDAEIDLALNKIKGIVEGRKVKEFAFEDMTAEKFYNKALSELAEEVGK